MNEMKKLIITMGSFTLSVCILYIWLLWATTTSAKYTHFFCCGQSDVGFYLLEADSRVCVVCWFNNNDDDVLAAQWVTGQWGAIATIIPLANARRVWPNKGAPRRGFCVYGFEHAKQVCCWLWINILSGGIKETFATCEIRRGRPMVCVCKII